MGVAALSCDADGMETSMSSTFLFFFPMPSGRTALESRSQTALLFDFQPWPSARLLAACELKCISASCYLLMSGCPPVCPLHADLPSELR